jgi:hypothetical protein
MKKLFLAVFLAGIGLVYSPKVQAVQFSLPFVTQQSTTVTSVSLVLSTQALVSTAYYHCLQHVTVESNSQNAQFMITTDTVTSSNTLSPDTTSYIVVLSSGVPYDTQWPPPGGWCAPANTQVNLKVTNGGTYTISCEEFTTRGWNP